MQRNLIVLSRRNLNRSPAMCCAVELEEVLVRNFDGQLVALPDVPRNGLARTVVFVAAINFGELQEAWHNLRKLRDSGARIVAYVFDSWNVREFFYNPRRRLRLYLQPTLALREVCDLLLVPFATSAEAFETGDRAIVRHVPLAVDSTLVNGLSAERSITLNAYGRQPEALIDYLSQSLNRPDSMTAMHHTNHFLISGITDMYAHRRQFWKIAQMSAIALAYDPRLTHPARFPVSIVGQRWFECLAAGCVVMGRRPQTPEADQLLDWPDATIELPEEFPDVVEAILALAGDTARLAMIRERNVAQIRARHDWLHRLGPVLAEL